MRFSRSDVRDHIVSSKIDHVPPQWRWQAMQQQRCLEIDFREIVRTGREPILLEGCVDSDH